MHSNAPPDHQQRGHGGPVRNSGKECLLTMVSLGQRQNQAGGILGVEEGDTQHKQLALDAIPLEQATMPLLSPWTYAS